MPRRETHYTIAFVLLILVYFLMNKLGLFSYFGYAVAILVGSVLPDVIEPAISNGNRKAWQHRQVFHSKRTLKGILILIIPVLILGMFFNIFLYLFFGLIGYILHLLMDSTTKMGLPD